MPKDLNRPIPPQVVENPSRGPMPPTPILSGGLGGAVYPNTENVAPVPTVNQKAKTFYQLLQGLLVKTNIDLGGIHISPYEDVSSPGDPGFNTNSAPTIKASNTLTLEIADAIVIASRNGDNSTPISGGLSGSSMRMIRRAIDAIKSAVKANEMRLIGVNSDPAGNADGRPGGQSGGDFGGMGRGGHTSVGAKPPVEAPDPELPPAEEEPEKCCTPVRGVMGIVLKPNVYEEKTLHFPRSDCCDDPDETEPNERIRTIEQDVERVPIIEVEQCVKVPPREDDPPPAEDDPKQPITGQGHGIGGAGSSGGSGGMGGAGGLSGDPDAGNTIDSRSGFGTGFNQYSKPGD